MQVVAVDACTVEEEGHDGLVGPPLRRHGGRLLPLLARVRQVVGRVELGGGEHQRLEQRQGIGAPRLHIHVYT